MGSNVSMILGCQWQQVSVNMLQTTLIANKSVHMASNGGFYATFFTRCMPYYLQKPLLFHCCDILHSHEQPQYWIKFLDPLGKNFSSRTDMDRLGHFASSLVWDRGVSSGCGGRGL